MIKNVEVMYSGDSLVLNIQALEVLKTICIDFLKGFYG